MLTLGRVIGAQRDSGVSGGCSATYRAEIVKEVLKEEKTLDQAVPKMGIYPT